MVGNPLISLWNVIGSRQQSLFSNWKTGTALVASLTPLGPTIGLIPSPSFIVIMKRYYLTWLAKGTFQVKKLASIHIMTRILDLASEEKATLSCVHMVNRLTGKESVSQMQMDRAMVFQWMRLVLTCSQIRRMVYLQ